MTGRPAGDDFRRTLRELRRVEPFASLPRSPWLAFIAIACHWEGHGEAWPSQATIARFTGYSLRAVRDAVAELERREILRLRRERPGCESDRIYYAPGPAAAVAGVLPQTAPMAALPPAAIAGRAAATAGTAAATAALVPAVVAGGARPHVAHTQAFPAPAGNRQELPPAMVASELRRRTKDLLLISEREAARADDREPRQDGRPTHDGPAVTDADQEVARMAVTECLQRAHPGAAGPFRLDDSDVRLVAACAAAVTGDRAAKLQALRDAIDGAYRTSQGAPRVRFIWGKLEHFLRHAADGRRTRLGRDPEPRNGEEPVPPPTRNARKKVHAALAGISPEDIAAGMARVFGPSWKPDR